MSRRERIRELARQEWPTGVIGLVCPLCECMTPDKAKHLDYHENVDFAFGIDKDVSDD